MDQITKSQIMIIGADTHFLYLMQRFVRSSAHQIVMASLNDDILSMARCDKLAAIVLEVDQPETAGWRTLRILKSDPEADKIPVIACSWLDEETHALMEGASIYLRMPILFTDFSAALESILSKEQNE